MSSTAFGTLATALNVSRVRGTWLVVTALVLMTPLLSDAQSPPMTYGAISDRTVRPYPPLPSLGGAGFQFTDPAFGSKMLRVTDQNTRPDRPGRAFFSPASAETNAWNTDSTKFFVTGEGGEMIPFSFNPTTMVASRMGNTSNGTGGLLLNVDGEPEFSYVDSDLIYGQSGSQIVSYRFSSGVQTALHDVHSCLPGIQTHGVGVSGTKDDQRLLVFVGATAQNLDTTVYVYDRTSGCRWLNTQTGQVGGQWGPTGAYTGDSGFTLHNARLSKNGKWAKLTDGSGSPAGVYFWNVETLALIPCNVSAFPFCPGHMVTGFNLVIDHRGLTDGLNFGIRPMNTPNTVTQLINPELSPTQFLVDTHPSWNNVQSDEKQPFCTEVFRTDDLVQRAWDGEIICVETDAPAATVWRFAHHRSRVVSFGDQPKANVSQDGRYVLFTSSWEQTLGFQPVTDGGGPRDDAFVVQLAPAPTTPPTAPTSLSVR